MAVLIRALRMLAGLVLLLAPAIVSASPSQGVEMTIIPCSGPISASPELEVSTHRSSGFHATVAAIRRTGAVYGGFAALPPGHYWLRVSQGKCHDKVPLTISAGDLRHVLFAPSTSYVLVTEGENWLYGSLPTFVGNVELRTAADFRYVACATIDGGSYYFELLPAGKYIVRFMIGQHIVQKPVTINPSKDGSGTTISLTMPEVNSAIGTP